MHRSLSPRRLVRHRTLRMLPAAAGALLCGSAVGQETAAPAGEGLNTGRSPFYYGAEAALTRESNIFRAQKGLPEDSDTYSTIALLAGLDQPFGRQRATADVAVRHNKYQDLSRLDNTGYSARLGLDWETIERLSGTVSLGARKSLARYGVEGVVLTNERNVETSRAFDATVQYGGESILTLYGLFGHRAIDYSLSSFDRLDYTRNQVGAGLRYRVSGALRLGVEARTARGEYPHTPLATAGGTVTVADKFDRHDVSLTAQWDPTGASRIRARLGASKQDREFTRDVSGAFGLLTWDWRPTGKLRLQTTLRRDTGQEINPLDASGNPVGDNSEVANQLQAGAFYDATAKIRVDALARYTRRSLVQPTVVVVGSGQASGVDAGHDATTVVQFGVRYEVLRTVTVGCAIGHEERRADSTVSFPYSANSASCFARLLLQ